MTGNSMRPRVMWLLVRIAAVHQTGEYHFHKDIRRYVTPAHSASKSLVGAATTSSIVFPAPTKTLMRCRICTSMSR